MANFNYWTVYRMGVYFMEPLENYFTNIDWNKAVIGRFFGPNYPSHKIVQKMVDTQWLTRGNIVVHRTGCYFIFACKHLADVEALLEQHTFVLDGRIRNVRRCNRYTVPANVNFDSTRLWIRVYGLPLGFLDPERAVKTLQLVGLVETLDYDGDGVPEEPEFREQVMVDLSKTLIPGCYIPGEFGLIWIFFRFSNYVAARRIHARMEAFEAQGRTMLYDSSDRTFYSNMVEGSLENFITLNTRVNLLALAQNFEFTEESSDTSDSDSSGSGGDNLPNGHVHGAAANGDNHDTNDNVEPEYIPINGVYQNGFMEHSNVATMSSSPTHSASTQGHESNSSPLCSLTATHRASSSSLGGIRFAAATQERYFTASSLSNSSGAGETGSKTGAARGGFRISATLEESFLTDESSDSEEFSLPLVITSNEVDVTPQMLANLSLEDNSGAHIPPNVPPNVPPEVPMRPTRSNSEAKPRATPHKRSSRNPFTRCRSYEQEPFFGYQGLTWSQKRRKIRYLHVKSKGGFTIPANDSRKAVSKAFSDVSIAHHLGFDAADHAHHGDTSTGYSSNSFMSLSGGKRKVEEAATTSPCKSQKLSVHGFTSKTFCDGPSASYTHLSSAFLDNFGGLLKAETLLKKGSNWKIGNGLSTLAVNGCVPEFKPGIPLSSSAAQTISFFIYPQTRLWDTTKVVDWFVPMAASTILAMEEPDTTQEDFRFWGSTQSGTYSMKTGYAILQQQLSPVPIPSSTDSFWKVLWSLQIQPKWKLFLWKLLHQALVVKNQRICNIFSECALGTISLEGWMPCRQQNVEPRKTEYRKHGDSSVQDDVYRKNHTETSRQGGNPTGHKITIAVISGGPVYGSSVSGAKKSLSEYRHLVNALSVEERPRPSPMFSISYSEEDAKGIVFPHDDLLVLILTVNGADIKRALVGGGSSSNILFARAFDAMRIGRKYLSRDRFQRINGKT
uniref:DUF4283 domain-containing protein n=1 Tax=Chenopodium quinoa TaxID=63459 RepID=A0A803N8W7_CHEQI